VTSEGIQQLPTNFTRSAEKIKKNLGGKIRANLIVQPKRRSVLFLENDRSRIAEKPVAQHHILTPTRKSVKWSTGTNEVIKKREKG